MKWCYVAFGVDRTSTIGICKKIEMQADALAYLTGDCDIFLVCDTNVHVRKKDWTDIIVESDLSQYLYEALNVYDVLYFRWAGNNKVFNRLLKRFAHKTLIVEIPTYPIIGEYFGKAKGKLKKKEFVGALKSFIGGTLLQFVYLNGQKRLVDAFVLTVLNQTINGCKTINILNAISPQKYKVKQCGKNNIIKMVSVANVSYWHGYDRVIAGLSQYKGNKEVEYVVIGEGSELNELKRQVKSYSLENVVKFVGKKTGDDLDRYFDDCDVAIGSLGLHRLGMKPSSLKSREYMARGIPFIITDSESMGDDSTISPFIYQLPGDESPVEIEKIVEWIDGINVEKASIALRQYAEENCSWISQMKKVVDEVNTVHSCL